MPYIGRGLTTGAQYQKLDAIAINNATTFTMSVGSSNVSPDQNHLILVVNGVIQEPGTGFTVSGSTCTLASAITTSGHSGTDTIYGVIAGDAAFAAYDSIGANALGVTAGTVTASRAVVPDSNKDIASFRNVTLTGELDAATLDISGNADIDGTTNLDAVDIDGNVQLDGTFTVGTDGSGQDVTFYSDTAGDSFVWDSSAEKLTITGTNGQTALDIADGNLVVADNIDLEGDIDVNGTANLDVVDIDGAVDMASTLGVAGVVTANAGVVVDNITIDGTEIDLSSGNLTLDVAGDIYLDAGDGDIVLLDDGTHLGTIKLSSSALRFDSQVSDQDITFTGNDGGSAIEAMRIDMSEGGRVGIGTTSPDNNVHIVSTSSETGMIIQSNLGGSGSAIGGQLKLALGARNNSGSGQADTQSGDILGQIMFEGQGTDYSYQGGNIKTIVTTGDGSDNRSNQATAMTFETIAVGSVSPAERLRITSNGTVKINNGVAYSMSNNAGNGTLNGLWAGGSDELNIGNDSGWDSIRFLPGSAEKMRIAANGNVSIGTTTTNLSKLHVEGDTNSTDDSVYPVVLARNENDDGNSYAGFKSVGRIDSSNQVSCFLLSDGANSLGWTGTNSNNEFQIRTNGSTSISCATNQVASGDFNDTSDIGYKENVTTIKDGLGIVNQLNPVTFDWKNKDKGSSAGVIAQELEKILPDLVYGENYDESKPDIMGKSVTTSGLVGYLIKAVQELSAKVEALENA